MNNQLKLLVYIIFIVGAFLFIQDRYDFFDVSLIENKKVEKSTDEDTVVTKAKTNYVEIMFANGTKVKVDVEVADTDTLRSRGLSNRRYLGDYNGMLFIYDEKGNAPFWMKDMYIPLDIIFIDEFGFIVDIKENMEPCTETSCPQIFATTMYKYVLEVNGGFSETNDIKMGQSVLIHLASSN